MKQLSKYMVDGWICHIGHDGKLEFGDGSQRAGMYYFLKYISTKNWVVKKAFREKFRTMITPLRLPSGEWVRHTDQTKWWGQPGTMSRDQLIPIISAMATMRLHGEMIDLERNLDRRFFFAWNTKGIWETKGWKVPDWLGPTVWALFERGKAEIGYPGKFFRTVRLIFYDVFLVLNSIARVVTPLFAPEHTSADKAHFIKLCLSHTISPTFLSKLSALIYFKLRPKGADWAFSQYFAPDTAPPLDRVMIEARKAVFPHDD